MSEPVPPVPVLRVEVAEGVARVGSVTAGPRSRRASPSAASRASSSPWRGCGRRSSPGEYGAALRYLRELITLVALADDAREGIAAFFDKRPPRFTGR